MEKTDDYTEDEYFVYIDFQNNLTSLEADDPRLDIKIIGIDTENPVMEVNGKTFKGTYEYSYCTNVLFEKDINPPILDPIYEKTSEKFYCLTGKTNKKITMKRIFLEPKNKSENETSNKENARQETLEEIKERLEVDATYEDALNLLLPPGRVAPRKIEGSESYQTQHTVNESKYNISNFKNLEELYNFVEDCDDDDIKDPDYNPKKDI
ncbi:general transcription factor 3C polypeptide 6 [Condylostylus longicornis]|uniref:general transcription factor 3C polypeptide 6 n=1 Tax=Condylostylus longicornis TaxID=2530218 RepID=UPI00244E26B5|nr:general transcription factor 3C polypeptide 6 [Condylostylus longicornis]